ncbi:MAG TPA: shikimate kinase [Thermoanaerobacterales bacterium]|nr:shikimate kinase [Thermoanaerobacterales bacterium]
MFSINIILTGFMGAGKTTIGRIVAKELNMKFIDTDEEIVRTTGLSITEIFERFGEEYFRDIEEEIIERVASGKGLVIASGGGIVLRERNINNLKKNGIIFLLTADENELLNRVYGSTDRPLIKKGTEDFLRLLDEREERYFETADYIIDTNKRTAESAAWEIIRIYNKLLV